MIPGSPLASEVLTVADSEFLRVETREAIAHIHHVLIIEHLMEVERSKVVVEQVLPILLTDSRPPISSHLLLLLLLLPLLLLPLLLLPLLLLPLLFLLLLLLPPQGFHLCRER